MIVLHETGQLHRVELVRTVVAFTSPPNETLLRDNPLGKIPALVLDDGRVVFDSRVICEYLDGLHDGPKLFPAEGIERLRQLRWLALGDGLTDILLLWRVERRRAQASDPVVLASLETKVRASFAALEAEAEELDATGFAIGHAAIVCAIGQLDFRFANSGWQEAHLRLAAWHDKVRRRPSVIATEIRDDSAPDPENVMSRPLFGRA